ncbi:MAG: type II toxin-antitoxin system VapC family toxin [Acidobacteria bacterium]|nr:type II toxin-antitoxin system VapC family toxin [Acidobacteriota bacterium]
MAESAVTDTHPLVYHAAASRVLGQRAAQHFAAADRQEAIIYVPAAVVWECALLARGFRINLRRTVREFFSDLFANPAYQPLDLSPDQIYVADEVRINRDPFDGLICAAALTLSLPLITRDGEIRESGRVQVIW